MLRTAPLIRFAAGIILLAAPLVARAATISDDTFADADWSAVTTPSSSPSSTFSASQQLLGGNPNAYRETVQVVLAGFQTISVAHVYLGASYDPATAGSIASIDFSLDVRFVSGSSGTSRVDYQLLIVQGGSRYNAVAATAQSLGPGNGQSGAWQSFSFTGLTAQSFALLSGSGPATPDFSSTGAPIQFGFLTLNGTNTVDIETTSGIDNFTVDIHPVPEASVGLLLTVAALGLAWRVNARRERREAP
jgi:hypothetical protein